MTEELGESRINFIILNDGGKMRDERNKDGRGNSTMNHVTLALDSGKYIHRHLKRTRLREKRC